MVPPAGSVRVMHLKTRQLIQEQTKRKTNKISAFIIESTKCLFRILGLYPDYFSQQKSWTLGIHFKQKKHLPYVKNEQCTDLSLYSRACKVISTQKKRDISNKLMWKKGNEKMTVRV